jgi:Protein phosphatase 2C
MQPNRPDETNRIRQAGGNVYFHGVWRVGGILAVSRYASHGLMSGIVADVRDVLTPHFQGDWRPYAEKPRRDR